ncbi:MAG: hypothetical protein PWQ37_225 [Candidatus Petromonas sp.]|jgi:predicted Fe-Mo cluster-binding NifX family protein|nr:hypothetical protein [Candidatus Petromonas sp.]
MRICVTSTGKEKDALTDRRFGRCVYFAIYDTETEEFTFVKNDGVNTAHGAGLAAAQKVIDEKADVVITGNLGPNAMKVLSASDIKVYQIMDGNIKDQIKYFKEGKLDTIDKPGPSHAGMGNRNRRGW